VLVHYCIVCITCMNSRTQRTAISDKSTYACVYSMCVRGKTTKSKWNYASLYVVPPHMWHYLACTSTTVQSICYLATRYRSLHACMHPSKYNFEFPNIQHKQTYMDHNHNISTGTHLYAVCRSVHLIVTKENVVRSKS
jgi:hypothetical protein